MNCQEARSFVEDALDRSLSGRVKRRLDLHLQHCKECRDFFEAERVEFVRWYRAVNCDCGHSHSLPTDFADRLVAAVMAPRPLPFFLRMPRWALVAASIAVMFMGAVFAGVVVERVISSAKEEAATIDVPESEAPQETLVADTEGDSYVPQNSFFEEVAESAQTGIAEAISTTKTETSNNTPSASTQENGENDKMSIRKMTKVLAAAFTVVTGSAQAENLYWKGGTGTESNPADIYDAANWTTDSSYSGDSISRNPTSGDILNFKFSALTYLTNSMENADSAAVCDQANFHDGDCVILGDVKSTGTVRIGQNSGETSNIELKGALSVGGVISLGQSGYGTLTVEDGGSLAVSSTSASSVGQFANSKGDLVVNGGTASFNGDLYVGNESTGTLTINGGTFKVASGKDTIVGGNGSGKTGTVNLNGGTLKTRCVKAKNGKGYLNFDGGTLQANANNTTDFINGNLAAAVNVQSGGGTIDANGYSVKIAKSLSGAGAMTFKGGGTITFSYNCNHEGGTTIELGTIISMTAVSTTTILNNLVIDGRAVLEAKTYDVFLKSGLTEAATNNITLVNCAVGSTFGFDNDETPTKITVTLAEPTCVNTTTPIMAFPGKTLDEIKYADFTSRMLGQYANDYNALDSAKGCNKKFYYDGSGNLASIVVEFQASDGANIRCVVVEFTDGEGGVYAKALGARYQANASLGFVFLEQDKTTWHGTSKVVTTSRSGYEYGVCDFRWTQGEHSVTAWTLDQDKTWSALRNGATLASDEIVQITVTDADAVLTVDEDVNVGLIDFVNGTGTTLGIASGVAVSADNYIGLGYVLNNGTFQKWGDGTVEMKFDNASRGVFVVNAGTLKATGKKTPVVDAGTPIIGDPDVTPRSNYLIDVKSGATYDVNGQTSVKASVRLAEGAHFISSADVADQSWGQTIQLILAGDADVTANGNFGIIGAAAENRLDLGSHTLTVDGASGKEFMLVMTTINGTGTISVNSGTLAVALENSSGEDCTLVIGASGKLTLANGKTLTIKNFTNRGNATGGGTGWLTVTGTLTPGNEIKRVTLANGSTVKASATTTQRISWGFSATGTVTIDASAITSAQLKAAADQRIPVLTVPTADAGGSWAVANPPAASIRAKWVNNGDGTSTLYLCKTPGTIFIIR